MSIRIILIQRHRLHCLSAVTVNKRSLLKEELGYLQKSYAETFSVHGLTRIIYAGLKERVLWCLMFGAAVVGLCFMNREIIEKFYNKDVRTEIRIEQRESLKWPSITICSKLALQKSFGCNGNLSLVTIVPQTLCSMNLQSPDVKEMIEGQRFQTKMGCVVYNTNGTLLYNGMMKRGLNIKYRNRNPNDRIVVSFYDPNVAKNSSQSFYMQDIDSDNFFQNVSVNGEGNISPGAYEFLLHTTEIKKLGPPQNSKCSNKRSISDKHHSRYTYEGCVDACTAKKLKESCGIMMDAFQDYFPFKGKTAKNQSDTQQCYGMFLGQYYLNNTFLNNCGCQQPCKQSVYEVTQKKLSDLDYWYLKIRFKSKMVNVIREYPLYTPQELVSQVGGICGLFLGTSLLSLVEVFFHAVISLVKVFL